ncbi:MAG: PQQ-binding-like beta-propeller repeat protein [Holophagales bacterium]|nr:PQQ-binding-like beta-propeller repeat protein [Holophagales bacterium]
MRRELAPTAPGIVERVVLSPDGRFVFGSTDDAVFLFERDGTERWSFPRVPAETLNVCEGSPPLFSCGTWNGTLRVHVPDGFAWERPVGGVVAAVAASESAGRVAAGSWDGTVAVFGLDGTPLARHRLDDAVQRLAVPPVGGLVLAYLASGRVVALDSGGEVWRAELGEPLLALASSGHETFAATPAGGFVFLDAEGRVTRRRPPVHRLVLAATASGGAWAACVETPPLLRLFRPEDGSGWETPLPAAPTSLALAGDAETPVCLVGVPPGRILAFNRWQVTVEEPLGGTDELTSLTRWGTEAAAIGDGGRTVVLVDLPALRRWLPPPRLVLKVGAAALVAGRVGTLALAVTNEGGRAASRIELRVASEFLRATRTEALGDLEPGETRQLRVAVEPERAGELLLTLTITFQGGPGETSSELRQEVVEVRPPAG